MCETCAAFMTGVEPDLKGESLRGNNVATTVSEIPKSNTSLTRGEEEYDREVGT